MRAENAPAVVEQAAVLGLEMFDLGKPPKTSAAARRLAGRLIVAPADRQLRQVFLEAGFRHLGLPGEDLFWMEGGR